MYLLDTHILIWWLHADKRLDDRYKELIDDPHARICVSVASLWEMSIKESLGKLEGTDNLLKRIKDQDFVVLPIEPQHTMRIKSLEDIHKDPFDRMLVAQALEEQAIIMTVDPRVKQYSVKTI